MVRRRRRHGENLRYEHHLILTGCLVPVRLSVRPSRFTDFEARNLANSQAVMFQSYTPSSPLLQKKGGVRTYLTLTEPYIKVVDVF